MFGKLFAQMYTGSMYGAGCNVFAVWGYAIANSDEKGFVELNPKMLSDILGATPAEIEEALTYLCEPDPESRTDCEQGKRLVRDGRYIYRLVNHQKYLKIRNREERREYQRQWAKEKREQT